MFDINDVNNVMKELQKKYWCFASEAHLQTAFIIEAAKLYEEDKFEFIPEYPTVTEIGKKEVRTEFDLLIFDKDREEKTLIEFKYKTANRSTPASFPMYKNILKNEKKELSNQAAQNDGRYACWSDIERIEQNVIKKQNGITNGFFIFVTNDMKYFEPFSNPENMSMENGMMPSRPNKNDKKYKIKYNDKEELEILNQYKFEYKKFNSLKGQVNLPRGNKEIENFQQLVIKIP